MNEFPFSIESRVEKEKKDKKKTYTVLVLSYLKVCTKEKMEFHYYLKSDSFKIATPCSRRRSYYCVITKSFDNSRIENGSNMPLHSYLLFHTH